MLTSLVNPRNWFAEAIATYALVFFGPLSIILSVVVFGDGLSIESIIMISLGHGAVIGLMVYAFGHISGAHINPAVTIPMMITKKISVQDGIGYIIFQLLGAIIAALAGASEDIFNTSSIFGFMAIILAAVNIFGGFLVTQRMLQMYKKKKKDKK